jgi:hypothetical protein
LVSCTPSKFPCCYCCNNIKPITLLIACFFVAAITTATMSN